MAQLVNDPPLISVMIPSYSYLQYITVAIDSVRAQSYPNLEIVVSDNRSTDGTVLAFGQAARRTSSVPLPVRVRSR